jgi:hypothetical protein
MSLIVKEPESNFVPAPGGLWRAVCVDVVDLGPMPNNFGKPPSPMVRLVWELEEKMEDGRPYVASRMYKQSLHEKSSLRKDLQTWRGKSFTADELKGFDLEKLLGVNSQIQIMHKLSTDGTKTYANVTGIMPPAKGLPQLQPSESYVRHQDRDGNAPHDQSNTIDDDADALTGGPTGDGQPNGGEASSFDFGANIDKARRKK